MVISVRRVSVFLSSPNDLATERAIASEVCEQINLDLGRIENFHIDLIKWETHAHSARSTSPQSSINEQIGDEYDIFLGMFGSKFGTPTTLWGSGTEEEFRLAIERNSNTSKPEIMFLFSNTMRSIGEIDPSELLKIRVFQKDLSDLGVLYNTFDNELKFRSVLSSNLLFAVRRVLKNDDRPAVALNQSNSIDPFSPTARWNNLLDSDSEVKASVMMQDASKSLLGFTKDVVLMGKSVSTLTNVVRRETSNINPINMISKPEKFTKSFNSISTAMQVVSSDFLRIIPSLHKNLQAGLILAQRAYTIFLSREEVPVGVAKDLSNSLSVLKGTVSGLITTVSTSRSSFDSIGALGTSIDVEKRKVSALLADIEDVLTQGVESITALQLIILDT